MMSVKFAPALFLLSLAIGQQQFPHSNALAQDIEYLATPELVWEAQTSIILDGNGVFTSPNDRLSVVTQANGNLAAFNTFTGESLWTFTPPSNNGLPTSCQGGATFSGDGYNDYLIYSVVDDPNGLVPFTRVISLSLDGNVNWISTPLEGAAAGSPLASFDGRYIYLTHNSNAMSIGHFSVLDTLGAVADTQVMPLYSEFNVTNPFTPPGIFHNPEEGYYDGGQGNTNDIVVWGFAPNPLNDRVGDGSSFVFQFPIGYASSNQASSMYRQSYQTVDAQLADEDQDANTQLNVNQATQRLYWIILGDAAKDWQAMSAPVLTNMGRSLYWSVTRSQFRSWVGQANSVQYRFNRGKTNTAAFTRGIPRWAACPNSPALSSHPTQPMIFAGTASTEFVKMDYLMDDDTALVRNTSSVVRSKAIVSPDDQYVYFSEFTGILHQASTANLEDNWAVSDIGAIDGEFSLTSDGSMLIIGDVTGKVYAYRVAITPTDEPTATPTPAPTSFAESNTDFGFRPTVDVPVSIPGSPAERPTRSPIFDATPTFTFDTPPTLPVEVSASTRTYLSFASMVISAAVALFV